MKNKFKIVILTALCTLALSCGNSNGGKVLFESSDKKIKVYEKEVNNELEKSLFSSGISEKELTPEQITQMKHSIIKNIALNRALALKAKEKKLDKDKKYTQSQEILQEQLLASLATLSEINERAKITDADAKAAYDANQASFTQPEDSVRLQVIVFQPTDTLKEAVANPNNFTAYVNQYNPGTEQSGQTQSILLSQLASRFGSVSEAIKDVKAGQVVNKVVNDGKSLYIVKVLERNPKGLIPFESVKEGIKTQLRNQKRQIEQQTYLKSISDEFKLSNMDEALKNIK